MVTPEMQKKLDEIKRNNEKLDKLKKRSTKKQKQEATAFNIDEFLVGPDYIQTKKVTLFQGTPRERDVNVRFGAISIKETTQMKGETTHAKGIDMLYRLLHQGDPKVTKEKVERMDQDVATELLKAITGQEVPLPESPKEAP